MGRFLRWLCLRLSQVVAISLVAAPWAIADVTSAPSALESRYLFAAAPEMQVTRLRCGTNEFPPFGYTTPHGVEGVEVDIVKEIGNRLGIAIDVQIYPWPRLLNMMKDGSLDCMFSAFFDHHREAYMDYTRIPLHVSRLALYVRNDRQFTFSQLSDLHDKHIGLIREFKTIPAVDESIDTVFPQVTYGNSFDQLFDLLMAERIDVVIVNHHVAHNIIHARGLEDVVELPSSLSSNSAFITFSKKKALTPLVPKFEYALFEIMAEGRYQAIFQKHQRRFESLGRDTIRPQSRTAE